jgi:hypothetical protein
MTDIHQEKIMNDIDIQRMFPGEPDRHMIGFRKPVSLSDNLKGFIKEANLGYADPFSENDISSLSSQLVEGHSTRGMLTQLFFCYIMLNGVRNGTKLRATPLMHKWFSSTFENLKKRKNFDPNSFRYPDVQYIISENVGKCNDTIYNDALYDNGVMVQNALLYHRL